MHGHGPGSVLAEGHERFRREVFPARQELFAGLATRHRPHTLFIGCSDARVVPELITHSEPGELFVIRTAGNLVPVSGAGAEGVASSIEYAVAHLGVREAVVCGHSGCGAMTALAEQQDLAALPATAAWLRYADAARARARAVAEAGAPAPVRVAAVVRANVAAQLRNLTTHPAVARALADGQLALRGGVFDIATGAVEHVDAAEDAGPPKAPGSWTPETCPDPVA
ncbi:carbonic anhydrase [Streptomyces sp. ODS28]|uniref:carbonic anhydrase n=1 Tax=Streptomyces sp. ODS28 TaxID=3136688 RepID=UPI0031E68F69